MLPGEAAQATPMPPEPPRPLPRPSAALWTIGALALAIAAAAWFARRAGAGVAASSSTPALAPFPELEAALSALAGEAPAPGHARLSAALRRYLGRALGFPAVESTTREIERQLAARRLDAGAGRALGATPARSRPGQVRTPRVERRGARAPARRSARRRDRGRGPPAAGAGGRGGRRVNAWPSFADPLWLLAARRAALARLAAPPRAPATARSPSAACRARPAARWRLHLPFYCRLAALAALVLALARPQLGYAWEESTTEGIDIQIAIDTSGSMGAEDFKPNNRLEVAKRVMRDFVAKRTGGPHRPDHLRRHRAHPLAAHHRSPDARRADRLDRAQHGPGRHRDRRRARQRRRPAQGRAPRSPG